LNINDQVRPIKSIKPLKKTRCNVTPYYYTITDISGKSIAISVGDRSVKIKEAKTKGGNVSQGLVIEILKYSHQKDFYKVKFDISDENKSNIDSIEVKELSDNKLLEYSKIEL
jgi:hypothetical protein